MHVHGDQTTFVPVILERWIARVIDDVVRRRLLAPTTCIIATENSRRLARLSLDFVDIVGVERVRTVTSELTREQLTCERRRNRSAVQIAFPYLVEAIRRCT